MKKMLKTVSGLLVAGLLVIGLCATVFAADENPSQIGGIVHSDNPAFYANENAADQTMTEDLFKSLAGVTDGTVVIYNWDMGTTDGSAATVTFTPAGAPMENQVLYLYHFKNGAWVLEAGPVQGSEVTHTFTDWSPVALVVYSAKTTPAPAPAPTPSSGTTPKTSGSSPKTGEVDFLLFAALAAVLVGSVAAGVAVRKNKA